MSKSPFFSWVCNQVDRDDEVGLLAGYIVLDSNWPASEFSKQVMRNYLRSVGRDDLVPNLSIAIKEFPVATTTHMVESAFQNPENFAIEEVSVFEPPFLIWCEANFPSPERVENLCRSGDPTGSILYAARVLSQVKNQADFDMCIELLTATFDAGRIEAARMISTLYLQRFDLSKAFEWAVRGARMRDKGCIRILVSNSSMVKNFYLQLPESINEAELDNLVASTFGDSGELEWTQATGYYRMGMIDMAGTLFKTSVEKGFAIAFGELADFYSEMGRHGEARDTLLKGAAAGDLKSMAMISRELIRNHSSGRSLLNETELSKHLSTLDRSVNEGLFGFIFDLVPFLARGDGILSDLPKVKILLTLSIMYSPGEKEYDFACNLMNDIFPSQGSTINLSPTIRWVFGQCRRVRSLDLTMRGAGIWLKRDMTYPTD